MSTQELEKVEVGVVGQIQNQTPLFFFFFGKIIYEVDVGKVIGWQIREVREATWTRRQSCNPLLGHVSMSWHKEKKIIPRHLAQTILRHTLGHVSMSWQKKLFIDTFLKLPCKH